MDMISNLLLAIVGPPSLVNTPLATLSYTMLWGAYTPKSTTRTKRNDTSLLAREIRPRF
jgi:hypothetical protein